MAEKEKSITYKASGVDVDAGNVFVKKLPSIVNSTFDKNVINGIGDFAALYSLENEQLSNPTLVSACDGVGTKIKLAIDMKNYSGIGQDLVAMNINDLICIGAKPLFFLDYLSMSKLNIKEHSKLIESIAVACKKAKVSLIGGETAEMPGIYSENDFDLAGFAVGIVDRLKKLPKEIEPGDLIYGLPSSGPHSNGFTLIRKLLEKDLVKDALDREMRDDERKVFDTIVNSLKDLSVTSKLNGDTITTSMTLNGTSGTAFSDIIKDTVIPEIKKGF